MRRNGRQGITVTDGTNVVIERNDIRDTRRATIVVEVWFVEPVHSKLSQRRFHLDIDFLWGTARAIVSFITITCA